MIVRAHEEIRGTSYNMMQRDTLNLSYVISLMPQLTTHAMSVSDRRRRVVMERK